MTQTKEVKRLKYKTLTGGLVPIILLLGVFAFGFFISDKIKGAVVSGMRFAVFTVIPIGFPFMVLGDFYRAYGRPEKIRPLSLILSKLIGIPKNGLGAFICGNVAGFPLGAKLSSELYTGGGVSKKEAEKIAAISNNPSIPFIISGVGGAMFGNVKIGVYLLTVIYISVVLTAILYRANDSAGVSSNIEFPPVFSFTKSVKNSAVTSIYIIGFISIFYAAVDTIGFFIKSSLLLAFISSFLEVTTAVNLASGLSASVFSRLIISSFALSFGGISVMMQSNLFLKAAGLSVKRYFIIKLTQGIIAVIITALSFPFLFYPFI